MDVEKLISVVSERRPLWDMRDYSYHVRDVQRKLWKSVAEEMGVEVEEVKKRWRGLRDVFRREYKKYKEHKSGDGTSDNFSSWAYYNQMLFLSDTVAQRKLHGNVSPEGDSRTDDSVQVEETVLSETSDDPSQQSIYSQQSTERENITSPPTSSTIHKRKKLAKNSADNQFLQIERTKLKLFAEISNMMGDSDYQFLVSLLPFLKSVPIQRKMIVRNKLQQVFIDETELA